MFFSSPLPQLHCRLFAKMGDDRPFVCSAPGCGQVSPLFSCPALCGSNLCLFVIAYQRSVLHFTVLYFSKKTIWNLKINRRSFWERTGFNVALYTTTLKRSVLTASVNGHIYATLIINITPMTFMLACRFVRQCCLLLQWLTGSSSE